MSAGGPRILLGVTGGIAAYKAAPLARALIAGGAEVRVVMTAGARAFVQPLTFQALTGNPVHTDLLDETAEAAMGHIELARWADLVLVAPASANALARLAHGLADDLLSTLCLATDAPLALAPAMNRLMWAHPATAANAALLEARGARMIGPGNGEQACGEVGAGRMVEPDDVADAALAMLGDDGSPDASAPGASDVPARDADGLSFLITAGPTHEPIDPVRYIGNRSSGKMGFAIAAAAARRGARVALVAGPVSLPTPDAVERIDVVTAAEMHAAVASRAAAADVFVSVAAVADYRVAEVAASKIKKRGDTLALELVRNPDILADVAAGPDRPLCVGFAAETDDVEAYARGKLEAKGLDLVAANRVGDPDEPVFGSDANALELYWPDGGHRSIGRAPKAAVAEALLDAVLERLAASRAAAHAAPKVAPKAAPKAAGGNGTGADAA